MELNQFTAQFAAQFDETDPATINGATKFRTIDEWSSLTALSIIAMVDEEYNVQLKGNDIVESTTVEDVFNIVKSRV